MSNKFTKSQEKIYDLMYMDYIKHLAKMKKKKEIQTIRIYSQDIGMEFDIEKNAMLIRKSGKNANNEKNGTDKSRKNQNGLRKGKLQVLGNSGHEHYQTSRNERKKKLY